MANHLESDLTIPSFTQQPQHSSTPIKQVKQTATSSLYESVSRGFQKPLTPQTDKLDSHPRPPGHHEGSYMQQVTAVQCLPTKDNQHRSGYMAETSFPSNLSSRLEEETISKQRHELQMLIGELRDRDKELNQIVATHQHQMQAWDVDRKRILRLEQKCAKLEVNLSQKCDETTMLITQLRVLDSNSKSKSAALENSQQQLAMMSDQQSHAAMHLKDLEENNKSLNDSVKGMISTVEQFEEKERTLEDVVKAKECEIKSVTETLNEMEEKTKDLEDKMSDLRVKEEQTSSKAEEWQQKYNHRGTQLNKLQDEVSSYKAECEDQNIQLEKAHKQIKSMSTELKMSDEREARKDEVIELQRSKQDRMSAEMDNLRQLYERQQRDLSLLHLNLESSKEMLARHSDIYSEKSSSSIGSPMKSSSNYSTASQSPSKNDLQFISPIRQTGIKQASTAVNVQPQTEKNVDHNCQTEQAAQTQPAFMKETLDDVEKLNGCEMDLYVQENNRVNSELLQPRTMKLERNLVKARSHNDFVEPSVGRKVNNKETQGSNKAKRYIKMRQATPRKVSQKPQKQTQIKYINDSEHVQCTTDSKDVQPPPYQQEKVGKTENSPKMQGSLRGHDMKPPAQSNTLEVEKMPAGKKINKNSVYGSPKTLVQMYDMDDSLSELLQAPIGQAHPVHAEPILYYTSMGHSSYNQHNNNVQDTGTLSEQLLPQENLQETLPDRMPEVLNSQFSYRPNAAKTKWENGDSKAHEQVALSNMPISGQDIAKNMYVDPRSITPVTENKQQEVEPSPLGKLEMLLTESREMVAQLEHTTIPSYFSSSKADKG